MASVLTLKASGKNASKNFVCWSRLLRKLPNITENLILKLKIKCNDIGCLRTRVHKQPINALYFEFKTIHLCNSLYQSPLILTELFQHNLINVSYLMACYLYQVMMTLHFLNDVANSAAESTQKSKITS